MFRKTLTIFSLLGLVLSVGLWGASYCALGFSADVVIGERHHEFGLGEGVLLYVTGHWLKPFPVGHGDLQDGEWRFEIHKSEWNPRGKRGWLPTLQWARYPTMPSRLRITVHLWLPMLIFLSAFAYLKYMPVRVRKKQKYMRMRRIIAAALLCGLCLSFGLGLVSYALVFRCNVAGSDGIRASTTAFRGQIEFAISHDSKKQNMLLRDSWGVTVAPTDSGGPLRKNLWPPWIEWGTTPKGLTFLICSTHFSIPTAMLSGLFWLAYAPIYRRCKREKPGLCLNCGYDLRGSKERCPECGERF